MVKTIIQIIHCPCGSTLSSINSLKKHLLSFKHTNYCQENNRNIFDISDILHEKYDLENLTSDSDDDTTESKELINENI